MPIPDPYKTSRRDFTQFLLDHTCPDNAKPEYKARFEAVHELLKLLIEHEAMKAVRIGRSRRTLVPIESVPGLIVPRRMQPRPT